MPELEGYCYVDYASASTALGVLQQPRIVVTDPMLYVMGQNKKELIDTEFEPNTATLSLRPQIVWEDTVRKDGGDPPQDIISVVGAYWREIPFRGTGKNGLSWFNSAADQTYSFTTLNKTVPYAEGPQYWLDRDNQGFAFKLRLGMAPKDVSKEPSAWADIYRRITWPVEALEGEEMFRVSFQFNSQPFLETSIDQGVTWIRVGTIAGPSIRLDENVETTLYVRWIKGNLCLWCGKDMSRTTFMHPTVNGYLPGNIKVEGKNGRAEFLFGKIRFPITGYYNSFRHNGPRVMGRPNFVFDAEVTEEHTLTGSILWSSPVIQEFQYQVKMESAPLLAEDPELSLLSATSPILSETTIEFPSIYSGPPRTGWLRLPGVTRVVKKMTFNPDSRLISREYNIETENPLGEWAYVPGNQALRITMGYRGSNNRCVGFALANMDGEHTTTPNRSGYNFNGIDGLHILSEQSLIDTIVPTRWCPYALLRLLLEHGQIVPSLHRRIPNCRIGRNPLGCPHIKMPASHPGWQAGTPVLQLITEIADILFATWGFDEYFNFFMQEFNPEAPYAISKTFFSRPMGDGSLINLIRAPLKRYNSKRQTRNEWTLIGIEQETGQVFAVHDQNYDGKYNRFSPGYKGYTSKHSMIWTGFVSAEFASQVLKRLKYWESLPFEAISFSCFAQPELQPLDVIYAQDFRTNGAGAPYFILSNTLEWHAAGKFDSHLLGKWTGRGNLPGVY
jgi:hypothetical protein